MPEISETSRAVLPEAVTKVREGVRAADEAVRGYVKKHVLGEAPLPPTLPEVSSAVRDRLHPAVVKGYEFVQGGQQDVHDAIREGSRKAKEAIRSRIKDKVAKVRGTNVEEVAATKGNGAQRS